MNINYSRIWRDSAQRNRDTAARWRVLEKNFGNWPAVASMCRGNALNAESDAAYDDSQAEYFERQPAKSVAERLDDLQSEIGDMKLDLQRSE